MWEGLTEGGGTPVPRARRGSPGDGLAPRPPGPHQSLVFYTSQCSARREHLPARAHQEQVQGVPRGGGQVDAGWPGGARGSWRVSAAGYDGLMDGQFSCG